MPRFAEAIVAVCHSRPLNLGHVGWGYELPNGQWNCGAVEGENWQGIFNGFWGRRVNNLDEVVATFGAMARHGAPYENIKLMRVDPDVIPNPAYADKVSAWVSRQPYQLINRNCMDSTYDILQAFAVGYTRGWLPKPENHWIPNDFFHHLPAISTIPVQHRSDSEADFELEDVLGKVPDAVAERPPWRDPDDPQYLPTHHQKFRDQVRGRQSADK